MRNLNRVMRTDPPSLLPMFRSQMQVEALGLPLLQPEREWSLDELAEIVSAPKSSIHRELRRATDAGLLIRDDAQRPHRYRAAVDSPAYGPFRDLLERTVGVTDRLRRELAGLSGVRAAAIHGSWAGGKVGPTSDIDVVVLADRAEHEAQRAIRRVCRSVGREADISMLSVEAAKEMAELFNPFWQKLVQGPRIDLVGDLTKVVSR
jgi:predicted nucleotidyltransferase